MVFARAGWSPWAFAKPLDFLFEATTEGRHPQFLSVIAAHYHRPCLPIRLGRRCKGKDVVAVLAELASLYPAPAFIRSDNGPEFNCFAEAQGLRLGPTRLVRGQHHHQHGHHRAGIPMGERIRGILQRPLPG